MMQSFCFLDPSTRNTRILKRPACIARCFRIPSVSVFLFSVLASMIPPIALLFLLISVSFFFDLLHTWTGFKMGNTFFVAYRSDELEVSSRRSFAAGTA